MALERSGNLLESGIYEGMIRSYFMYLFQHSAYLFHFCYPVTLISVAGNHYGTPKPSKEPPVSPPQSSGSNANLSSAGLVLGALFPGAHPSSEGKRKRNRSNVEAMAAKNMEPEPVGGHNLINDGNFFHLFILLLYGSESSVKKCLSKIFVFI